MGDKMNRVKYDPDIRKRFWTKYRTLMKKWARRDAKIGRLMKVYAGNEKKMALLWHIRRTLEKKRRYLAELPGKTEEDYDEFDGWLVAAEKVLGEIDDGY